MTLEKNSPYDAAGSSNNDSDYPIKTPQVQYSKLPVISIDKLYTLPETTDGKGKGKEYFCPICLTE